MVHSPGHRRDAFLAAADAFVAWQVGPEPTILHDKRQIPISAACSLVVNCTDTMPAAEFHRLADAGLGMKRQTYAACARAMRKVLRAHAPTASTDPAQRQGDGSSTGGELRRDAA